LDHPHGKCFVSHSYSDETELSALRSSIKSTVDLFVFPKITVSPKQMVSNQLLKAIDGCDSLVYLTGDHSINSPWVTLEKDYALRTNKPVYSFDAAKKCFTRDRSNPMDIPVFPTYSRSDEEQVDWILRVMKDERYFDLFIDYEDIIPGDNITGSINNGVSSRLQQGGYVVVFWGKAASECEWVKYELSMSAKRFPEQILLAQLDDTELPEGFCHLQPVHLYNQDTQNIDMNRLDDLIVRVYWLIDKTSAPA